MIVEIKKAIKKKISRAAKLVPLISRMGVTEAISILDACSARPMGTCVANNNTEIEYDLQIIIPAYNVEKFIGECLDSVAAQRTQYKVLVTIVNDGSTDHTADIIDRYIVDEKLAFTTQIISQENRGLSAARNVGFQSIRGKYLMFLDSDDMLPPDAIDKMLNAAFIYDADILQGSWYDFIDSLLPPFQKHITKQEGLLTENQGIISGYPWGKLYKYTVMKHFQFPEGFWFEDTPISFILAAMPYRFAAIKDVVYGYRFNPNGITAKSKHSKKAVDTYWITEECLRECPVFGIAYNQRIYEYLLKQCVMNFGRTRAQTRKVREAIFVLTNSLSETYFSGFVAEDMALKDLEYALRRKRFVQFEMIMLGIV